MSTVFNGGRPIDQLRLAETLCYRQSDCKSVARCKLCNLYNITHDFVDISKCSTFTSTFTSSTFEK